MMRGLCCFYFVWNELLFVIFVHFPFICIFNKLVNKKMGDLSVLYSRSTHGPFLYVRISRTYKLYIASEFHNTEFFIKKLFLFCFLGYNTNNWV